MLSYFNIKNKFVLFLKVLTILSVVIGMNGCGDDDDKEETTTESSTQLATETFSLNLSPKNQVEPSSDLSNNKASGNATLELTDLELKYTITLSDLGNDTITAGHIHIGDALSNGGLLVAFLDLAFIDNKASGTITLTEEEAQSFENPQNLYLNLHSTDAPSGLLRAQLSESGQIFSLNLSPKNQIDSPIDLTQNKASGEAMFLLDDLELKYTITLSDLGNDTITAGHIHIGDALSNGGVLVAFLDLSFIDNKASGSIILTEEEAKSFENPQNLYLNLHSTDAPSGLLRAQVSQ